MKGFHIVVLLSSAVLRVSAAPAPELVTCGEEGGPAAARLAMHRINENHDHGYKFRLQKIQSHGVEKVDGGCNLELQLNLLETVCYNINPKPFEDCQIRGEAERAVMANCTVQFSIRNNDANLTKYECDTRQVKTNQEMMMLCPDCPMLVPLNSVDGLKSVKEAVSKFNQNTTNQHYYILKEVGRIRVGHVLGLGMHYYTEFELVETHCPMGSRINPEACQPLCPDRAHHAFCQSSYSNATGLKSVACDFYPPSNTTALGPGEQEPLCRHHGGGHPPHVGHGHGPPPPGSDPRTHSPCLPTPPGGDGHPPHEKQHHGPPFGSKQHFHPFHPFHPFHRCRGSDPALHPICPWPRSGHRPGHRPSHRQDD
ncbi:alpha-2-HS-glycoprotein 1 isoform X2 [Etheostoma spectabile]|uniref:alpha-2-HS-glycoprotein 1 isoform X2 n=1 Tax=Etheostoma spectabile TaxID=54343 RepID=UPI0013AF1571|nr:alpha-2-HS-glycoprotein-like isoform X2 [Etheostoma spectabile]